MHWLAARARVQVPDSRLERLTDRYSTFWVARFERMASGWRLSAAFDMNPSLAKAEHALTLDGASAAPNMNAVLNTAELYRLERASAQAIVAEVNSAVLTWRDEAQQCGAVAGNQTHGGCLPGVKAARIGVIGRAQGCRSQ